MGRLRTFSVVLCDAALVLSANAALGDGLTKVGSKTVIVDRQPRWTTVARQSAMPLPLSTERFIVPFVSEPVVEGVATQRINFQAVSSGYAKDGEPVKIFETTGTSCCGTLAENAGAKFTGKTHVVVPIFTFDKRYEIFGFPVFPDGTALEIGEPYTRGKDGHQNGPVIIPIEGNKAFAMWADFFHEAGESEASVRGVLLSSDGVPTGPDILIERKDKGFQYPVDGAQLSEKRLLLVWKDMINANPVLGTRFLGRLMRPDGGFRGGVFEIARTDANFFLSELRVTALPSSEFVATWIDDRSGAPRAVYQRFSGAGAPVGALQFLGEPSDTSSIRPDVVALADGRFVVSGTLTNTSGASSLVAQLVGADGTKIGGSLVLQALSDPDVVREHHSAPSATLVGGPANDVYVTWRIDKGRNYSLFGQAVRASP
jgi:hypothetical protein